MIFAVERRFPSTLLDTLLGRDPCTSELVVDGARDRVYFRGIFIVNVEPVGELVLSLLTSDISPPINRAS